MNFSKIRRPDTSNALIHLTGPRKDTTPIDALISILKEGIVRGSNNSGYIKGGQVAACFTEMPLSAIYPFVCASKSSKHPYECFGVAIHKVSGWSRGLRPVIYLPDEEANWIPENQRWRHVRYEYGKVDFSHEREWRINGDFSLDGIGFYVIVPDGAEEEQIHATLHETALRHILGFLHMNSLREFI
jgi:hypothetical protein